MLLAYLEQIGATGIERQMHRGHHHISFTAQGRRWKITMSNSPKSSMAGKEAIRDVRMLLSGAYK